MSEKTQQDFAGFYTTRPFYPEGGTFRIENENFILKVNKDGMILLHLKKDYLSKIYIEYECKDNEKMGYKWSYYTIFLNSIYLLLDSITLKELEISYFEISEVTTKDVMVVTLDENESIKGISYKYAKEIAPYESAGGRFEIPESLLKTICETLQECCKDRERIHILAELEKGLSEYKILNFSTSLVLLWFVIEQFISKIWDKFLEENNKTFADDRKRINSDRRIQLTRYMGVHKKLNLLELTENIDFETFLVLDELRDIRNKITHQNNKFVCKAEHCQKAFDMAKYFLEIEYNIKITFNTSYSLIGIYDRK